MAAKVGVGMLPYEMFMTLTRGDLTVAQDAGRVIRNIMALLTYELISVATSSSYLYLT